MSIGTGSLFVPRGEDVLLGAVEWIESMMLGSIATVVAILAVAGIGFMLLQGRLAVRDGVRVVLGCFILFGAVAIAQGIRTFSDEFADTQRIINTPVTIPVAMPDVPARPEEYDPYAGASVPVNRRQ